MAGFHPLIAILRANSLDRPIRGWSIALSQVAEMFDA